MSNLSRFLKTNKTMRENTTFAATRSLTDEKGNPLPWTIRPITTKENESIRESCTFDVQVQGKPNLFRPKLNTAKYIGKMLCASVAEPNLYDKELQDSYGVMTPEELLIEMIDGPGEYQEFVAFIQEFNGFTASMDDKVEEAKN